MQQQVTHTDNGKLHDDQNKQPCAVPSESQNPATPSDWIFFAQDGTPNGQGHPSHRGWYRSGIAAVNSMSEFV
jgi:hypothetical protein